MTADTHYFLCANTGRGFFSIYDEIIKSDDTRFFYIIKGGPGCGKLDFFTTLGKGFSEKGFDVEYYHCSGDPEALDGLFIPALGTAFLDGSAAHVLEPDYTGQATRYICLDELYISDLSDKKKIIKSVSAEYKSHLSKAYRYLAAAYEIGKDIFSPLFSESIAETITRRTEGICAREFSDTGRAGVLSRRFLSAFTYQGIISRYDTVKALCEKVCIIDNEFGFAPFMLKQILEKALKCGYKTILCPSPLSPEIPEHLLIPELSLAFISVTAETPYGFDTSKHVRLDALVDKDSYHDLKHTLREEYKLCDSILEKARQSLFLAKSAYDRLEETFRPNLADLDAAYDLAKKYTDLSI